MILFFFFFFYEVQSASFSEVICDHVLEATHYELHAMLILEATSHSVFSVSVSWNDVQYSL